MSGYHTVLLHAIPSSGSTRIFLQQWTAAVRQPYRLFGKQRRTQIWLTKSQTACLSSCGKSVLCRPADVIAKATDLSCCTSPSIDSVAALSIAPCTRVLACVSSGARALVGIICGSAVNKGDRMHVEQRSTRLPCLVSRARFQIPAAGAS